jgi:hypothetical protein
MSARTQTIVALAIVAVTVALLVRIYVQKCRKPGCGGDCGALSPEVKKLQARLKK